MLFSGGPRPPPKKKKLLYFYIFLYLYAPHQRASRVWEFFLGLVDSSLNRLVSTAYQNRRGFSVLHSQKNKLTDETCILQIIYIQYIYKYIFTLTDYQSIFLRYAFTVTCALIRELCYSLNYFELTQLNIYIKLPCNECIHFHEYI